MHARACTPLSVGFCLPPTVQLLLRGDARRVGGEDPAPVAGGLVGGGERRRRRLQDVAHHPGGGRHLPLEHRRGAGGDGQRGARQVSGEASRPSLVIVAKTTNNQMNIFLTAD